GRSVGRRWAGHLRSGLFVRAAGAFRLGGSPMFGGQIGWGVGFSSDLSAFRAVSFPLHLCRSGRLDGSRRLRLGRQGRRWGLARQWTLGLLSSRWGGFPRLVGLLLDLDGRRCRTHVAYPPDVSLDGLRVPLDQARHALEELP